MQIQSKVKRDFIVRSTINWIPDWLIAIVVASSSNEPLVTFLIVLLGLQAAYLAIWLKNTLWSWLVFHYFDKKAKITFLLDWLKEKKYPEPDDYIFSPEEYFTKVMNDENNSLELRLSAAMDLGSINVLADTVAPQHRLRFNIALEEALAEFKRSFH